MAYGDLDLRNKKYYVEVIQYDSIRRFEDCTYTYFSEKALDSVAQDVAYFARKEGLTAHAKSAIVRSEDKQ